MKNPQDEEIKIVGEFTTVQFNKKLTDDKIKKDVLPRLRIALRNKDSVEIEKLREEKIVENITENKNLVTIGGRNVLARLLAGNTTYSGEINYGAFGSGSSAFTENSTQLNTEVYRKITSSSAFDNNIAYIDWFIESADIADQTFNEFGSFIDGTGTANSGRAFSLLLTGGWVKNGSMFVSATYTLLI